MKEYLETGKRISFVQLLKNNTIVIPLIQRDYVQGRLDENEVREGFLNTLLRYLREKKPFRDLDFIYGLLDEKQELYPLDGQQRLTTLMLLHWYLANKEKKFEKYKQLCLDANLQTKFSYENRISSKEFCQNLFSLNITFDKLLESDNDRKNSLTKTIKNYSWYAPTWNFDPTVQNMLNMLDAIHLLFENEDYYFDLLTDDEKPIITFLFMDLGKHNLSDDLYIKMNARGVELSAYENFKAKFEGFITSKKDEFKEKNYKLNFNNGEREIDFKTYYTHKLDGDWSNIIWNVLKKDDSQIQNPKEFDRYWTNVFRISFYHSVLNSNMNDKDKEVIIGKLFTTKEQLSFYNYTENFKNKDNENLSPINTNSVKGFVELMDLLEKDFKAGLLTNLDYSSPEKLFGELIKSDYKEAKYQERIIFFAYTEFLKIHKGDYEITSLQKWIRFIRNLTMSTGPYNNSSEFLNSIKYIKQTLSHSTDIDEFLRGQEFKDIVGFDSIQYREEIIKRKLEKADNEWYRLFKKAELHPYLKGQTKFLLTLINISEDHCNVQHEHKVLQTKYKGHYEVFTKLFNDNGLNQKFSKNGEFIFERSLLSLGDYTITEGQNKSFLIDNDRDISWKRLLKFDKKENHKKIIAEIFKELLDSDITTVLSKVIDKNRNCIDEDWRKLIVDNPAILSFYKEGKRYFRENSNHGFVLLKRERVSGHHAELESYNFYCNHINDKWMYFMVSGENKEDIPCAYINFKFGKNIYGLDVGFIEGKFKIAIKEREHAYTEELKKLLISEGFLFGDNNYYYKSFSGYSDCENYIKELQNHLEFSKGTPQY